MLSALLLLVGQLFWLGAPALCPMSGSHSHPAAGAPAHLEHSAPALPGAAGCVMIAACGAPAQVVAAVAPPSFVPLYHRLAVAGAPSLRPAEPAAPLPPPPQA